MSVYNWSPGRRRGVVRPSPVFLGVLAVAALGGAVAWFETDVAQPFGVANSGSRLGDFAVFVFVIAAWIVSVCLHEFAHAFVAYRAGDRAVEGAGYLTLNPLKYTQPVLSVLLPVIFIISGGIGLPGGAVYLHPHMFRSKASRALASAIGPAVNLVIGGVLVVVASGTEGSTHLRFWSAVAFLGFLQLSAAVLNLLPVPGLDGWGVVEPYVSRETALAAEKIKPWGLLGVIVLLSITTVNDRFFELVNTVYHWFGSDDVLPALGRLFFKFWVSSPL